MKVYRKVVIDKNGKIIEEDSYEYDGEVAQCQGWEEAAIAAAIMAAGSIVASQLSQRKGRAGGGEVGLGGGQPFKMPENLFQEKGQEGNNEAAGRPLMGQSFSQEIAPSAGQPMPQYGPMPQTDPMEELRKRYLAGGLMGGGWGY
jgi:hypothetical protein